MQHQKCTHFYRCACESEFFYGWYTSSSKQIRIDENQLMSSVLNFPHLRIAGIHVHLRSQILDADLLCTYYQNCYALAERISQMQGIDLSFINFGSGIGTVYDISTENLLFSKNSDRP